MRTAAGHSKRAREPRRPSWARCAGAGALLLCLAACADETPAPPRAPVYDLGDHLAFATTTLETSEIAIGTIDDETHLRHGWSHRETEPASGRTFRWGLEPESAVSFLVAGPRPVTLRLEGRPRRGPAEAPGAVEVEVNGGPAGRVELRRGRHEYSLALAADLLRRGENRLRLRYDLAGDGAAPRDDDRRLAVAWYRIGFAGLVQPGGGPRLDDERGVLLLPWGSRADFFLRAPPGGRLRAPRRRLVSGDGELVVHLGRDGDGDRRLAGSGAAELDLALPAEAGEAVRLSLAAVPAGPADGRGGIALERPAVWAGGAPVAEPAAAAPRITSRGERKNLVIYLVDTLRADHLGCYGHPRPVSPRIDRFAAGATLFENMRAQAPWTLPSVASVMTGMWPPAHGVFEDSRRLAPEAVTLAETLSAAGYQTAGIVTNGFATGAYGLDQGFDEMTLIEDDARKSHRVHEAALAWLERRDRDRPFFLYLHTIDPHKPYLPDEQERLRFAADAEEIWRQISRNPRKQRWEPSESNIAQLKALYDAEIAQNDASFGATMDGLAAAGLYDDALLVFLSDHGEEFYEHNAWTHASNVYPEVLNVPLIVKLPGQHEGRRVAELAQQIDLMPTLLAYLGIGDPPAADRLLPGLLGPGPPRRPRVFSHTKRKAQTTASVIDGDWKLIRRADDDGVTQKLFNWRQDPEERVDLAADRPVLAGLLAADLARRLAESVPPGVADAAPDEKVLDNLRDLGYVD